MSETLLSGAAPAGGDTAPRSHHWGRHEWSGRTAGARYTGCSTLSGGPSRYQGSYETVKRFVRPLRAAEQAAERAAVRFETPPGQQSQIDWGLVLPLCYKVAVWHSNIFTDRNP
jgi:hypothetical protein